LTPATILFVCTGNICRSPLAEAAAEHYLRSHLGVAELADAGLETASAGTHAIAGLPASREMRMVAAEIDLDLAAHRSTPIELTATRPIAMVLTMERRHSDWLFERTGEPGSLLGGSDIDDPYGRDLATYRRVRDEIVRAVHTRLPEMMALARRR
jgi:protein-tyrosine phosphatase